MTAVRAGERLDEYLIESLVARSGMASIFRGRDLRTGRQLAIKIPHPEMKIDPVFFECFQYEEKIGRKLSHPRVMKVLSAGDRTQHYLVMEWVEGRLLRQVLDQTPHQRLSLDRAVRIAFQLCEALEYIHENGVVHCDLKPENVMIDAADNVKLIDFGIAADSTSPRLNSVASTQILGTPDYMSPEQVQGQGSDARSDLYALGLILYEMLTGRMPFTGRTAGAVMKDRLLNPPVPPREIDLAITPQLQEIVYRALERDPKRRYASARDFAWDLEHLNQVSVADRPELRDGRRKWFCLGKVLSYVMLALMPVLVFTLLLYVARHDPTFQHTPPSHRSQRQSSDTVAHSTIAKRPEGVRAMP